MYTEKVMEHFRHPHNMGVMENPDGEGEVGNPACLTPDMLIHLNGHMQKMSKIALNDLVLTHNGTYSRVKSKFKRRYSGEVLTLKNKLGTITLTPEHLVLALKVPKKRKYFDYKIKKGLTPAWYHAENLEKRDIVLYPVLTVEKDIPKLKLNEKKPKYDFRSKKLPDSISLDKDFLRLCGYYLAEGCARNQTSKSYVEFTFNSKENEYARDVNRIVFKKFGLDVKIKRQPKRKTLHVYVYSARLARFFKKMFGTGAGNKQMPHVFLYLPIKKQKELIKGIWRGDGYINLTRVWPRAGYATISRELIQQIKVLLLRQRIVPSVYEEKAKEADGVKHKKAHRIHVGDKESLRKLASILGLKLKYDKKEKTHSWFNENFFHTPITKIERIRYSGDVLNLEVENTHSFTSDSFCIHNCGDVMTVQIKVKDGRIIDIKFQTFGCAAAIATSSMITDLAKGKTLEEAMKITRADVAEELGGLPPIKMHCSNLAADALHAAIKNYLEKK